MCGRCAAVTLPCGPLTVPGDSTIKFIPIKSLAATGSGGPGSYAGHSRFPSRHHGRPASTGGFDDATALDAAVDMLDPQPAGVERLVGCLLRRGQVRTRWFPGRHEDLHL